MSGIPLTGLTLPHVCACPRPGSGFQTSYVVIFLCSVSSAKMRGSLCWYWWNWWPSQFKLSLL